MTKTKTVAWAGTIIASSALVGVILYVLQAGPRSEHSVKLTPAELHPPHGAARFDTPNHTFASILNAAFDGDAKTLVAGFDQPSADQQTALKQVATAMGIGREIRLAAAARFGEGPADRLVARAGFVPPVNLDLIDQLLPNVDGDTAVLAIPQLGNFSFSKVDGLWKLSPEVLEENAPPLEFFARVSAHLPDFQTFVADIKAGKYPNIAEVQAGLRQLITQISGNDPAGDPPDHPALLGPQPTPKETLAALYWAQMTGDEAAGIASFDNPSADQQIGIRQDIEIYNAGEQIRSAIADKCSARKVSCRDSRIPETGSGLDPGFTKNMLASLHESAPLGDKVQFDLPAFGVKIKLAKSDGVWRMDPALITAGNLEWSKRLHNHFLPMYLQLAADIKAGKYKTVAELRAAVESIHQEMAADHKRLAPPATSP